MKITYTIKQLEEITGIKAHTIRTWEKRYAITCPLRNCHNVRKYTSEDLKTLTRVAFLARHGMRISKICELSPSEIADHVSRINSKNANAATLIDTISLALMSYDASKVECIVQSHIQHKGVEQAMSEMVFPLIDRLSLLQLSGTMNATHAKLLGDIVEQKLRSAIDALDRVGASQTRLMLFSTVAGLKVQRLYTQYVARKCGFHVIPFGHEMDAAEVAETIQACRADVVFALHSNMGNTEKIDVAAGLCGGEQHRKMIVCTNGFHVDLQDPSASVQILEDVNDALEYLISPLAE